MIPSSSLSRLDKNQVLEIDLSKINLKLNKITDLIMFERNYAFCTTILALLCDINTDSLGSVNYP